MTTFRAQGGGEALVWDNRGKNVVLQPREGDGPSKTLAKAVAKKSRQKEGPVSEEAYGG